MGATPSDELRLGELAQAAPARRVAGLVAGRAFFRLAQWTSALALLALWGEAVFATYAIALEVSAWLIVVVSAGTEKALLTLVPRHGGEAFVRPLVAASAVPHVACLLALALAAAAGDPGGVVTYAAAAAYSTGLGLVLVLAALLRVRGRPGRDPLGLGLVGGAHLVAAATAYALDLQPRGVLVCLAAAAAGSAIVLFLQARAAGAPPVSEPARPGRWSAALRTAVPMGAFELANAAAVAVGFAVLGASSRESEASALYIVLAVSQVFLGLLLYLTRLGAPYASVRAEARGAETAYAAARRVLRRAAIAAVGTLAVALPAAVAVRDPGLAHDVALVLGVAAAVALTAVVLYGCFLIENADRRGRRISATAAVAGFAVAAAGSLTLAPFAGSVGVVAALLAGLAAQSTVAALATAAREPRSDRSASRRDAP